MLLYVLYYYCIGWYYKFVGPYTDDIVAVIPGYFQNKVNVSNSEAFIMVVVKEEEEEEDDDEEEEDEEVGEEGIVISVAPSVCSIFV